MYGEIRNFLPAFSVYETRATYKALNYWLVETKAKITRFDGRDKKLAINQLSLINQVSLVTKSNKLVRCAISDADSDCGIELKYSDHCDVEIPDQSEADLDLYDSENCPSYARSSGQWKIEQSNGARKSRKTGESVQFH